mgnify:CR=1 FL=1
MYSVKPGRGPSLMGGIGAVIVAVFGVIWTVLAVSMGAPPIFPLFGVVFILAALGGAVYNFYNAAGRHRISSFDITARGEEPDPIAKAMGYDRPVAADSPPAAAGPRKYPGEYCPFCGTRVGADFDYCPKCGKDI